MNVNYKVGKISKIYNCDKQPICSYLTNQKADSLLISNYTSNFSYFGYSYHHKSIGFVKLFNQFELDNIEHEQTIYEGFKTTNLYNSKFCVSSEKIKESYYLGPSGGLIYSISGYQGRLKLNFDIRKLFSNISAIYSTSIENGVLFVKGILEAEEFYIGINSQNISYHILENFEKKIYDDGIKVDLYKALEFDIGSDKTLYIGVGLSKLDVLEQLQLLEFHKEELMNFDLNICNEIVKNISFEKPIQEQTLLSYSQSIFTYHQLFKRTFQNKISNFLISGFPTKGVNIFEELLSLRTLINRKDFIEVKLKLDFLLSLINQTSGSLKIYEESSKTSLSALFMLVKRIEDLIFALDRENKLFDFYTYNHLERIYLTLVKSFNKITQLNWSPDLNFLFSNMEDLSIEVEEGGFYLETQVGYLNFISVLSTLSTILNKKESINYIELEQDFRAKIKEDFFIDNILIHKLEELEISSSVFMAYYFYPNLLLKTEWEQIFNFALKRLKNDVGFKIYSKFHKYSKASVYIHSNEEIRKDESLIWLNHIAAMCLYDVSEKNYRDTIREILNSSNNLISNSHIIGSCPNIIFENSSKDFPSISLSGTATYLELIELIHKDI